MKNGKVEPMKDEKEVMERFIKIMAEEHPTWRVQTEMPLSEGNGIKHFADGRVVQVDKGIVEGTIAYIECKGPAADAKELQAGYAQCILYCDLGGAESWYVLPDDLVKKFLTPDRAGKLDGRIKIYNVDKKTLMTTQTVVEQKSKSRMKQKQETPSLSGWQRNYTILLTAPLALTQPDIDAHGNVKFNIGMRAAPSEVSI